MNSNERHSDYTVVVPIVVPIVVTVVNTSRSSSQ